jgi:hypothetical protein
MNAMRITRFGIKGHTDRPLALERQGGLQQIEAAVTESVFDKNQIVVGQPLPCSIYAADNTLLLAAGQAVASEAMRELLARNGTRVSWRAGDKISSAPIDEPPELERNDNPLARFAAEHAKTAERWRPSLRMSRDETAEGFAVRVLAVSERNTLILTAPMRVDGSWVTVIEGQPWVFRTLYHTAALRFQARVLKVAFEPFPHLHVVVPTSIERRNVRKAARVVIAVPAMLSTPENTPALVMDMSTGGARVAVSASTSLHEKQTVTCAMTLPILDRNFPLRLPATVLAREATDGDHPDIASYRLQFESLSDADTLALHAYLNGVLAMDMDSFWRLIALNESALA